jgi:3-deoxy-manno-octulosonate cytidylyltransferase (CMP-KDO synthetase)
LEEKLFLHRIIIKEVISKSDIEYLSVINIQGDEPFIDPKQIMLLAKILSSPEVEIATLAKTVEDYNDLFNSNKVKVVLDKNGYAIYFSRAPIPFQKETEKENWLKNQTYFKHIGMYGYKVKTLHSITKLAISSLEKAESLEQLRWIENGFKIKIGYTEIETDAIDTEDDYQLILNKLKNKAI